MVERLFHWLVTFDIDSLTYCSETIISTARSNVQLRVLIPFGCILLYANITWTKLT